MTDQIDLFWDIFGVDDSLGNWHNFKITILTKTFYSIDF